MKEQLKAVMKAKTIREAFELLPWSFIEAFAAIPTAMFIFSALIDVIMMIVIAYPYLFLLGDMWVSFYILGIAAILLYIGKCYVEKIKFRDIIKQNLPTSFFVIMSVFILISTTVNGWNEYAIHGHPNRHESIFMYFTYYFVFFFLSSIIGNEKIKKFLIHSFIAIALISGICVAISLIRESYTFAIKRPGGEVWIIGIFNNPNHYGYYLTVAAMCSGALFAIEKNILLRIIGILSFIINTVMLMLNDTFGCYVAVLCGLIFMPIVIFIKDKKINISSIVLLAMFAAITIIINNCTSSISDSLTNMENFTDLSDVEPGVMLNTTEPMNTAKSRLILWIETIKCAFERPLVGYGTEGIKDHLAQFTGDERTHNEFLQYFGFYGIPAGICYFSAVMSVFIHGLKNKKNLDRYTTIALIAAFAYCVSAFFGSSRTYTAPYLFIFLGLGFGICNKQQAEKE